MSFDHGGTYKIIFFDAVGYLVTGFKIMSIVFTATNIIWFLRYIRCMDLSYMQMAKGEGEVCLKVL